MARVPLPRHGDQCRNAPGATGPGTTSNCTPTAATLRRSSATLRERHPENYRRIIDTVRLAAPVFR